MSAPLSPIFYLFLAPFGKLYLKVQDILAHDETHDASPPTMVGQRRPEPKHPHYAIPAEHWPTVVHRMAENNEPLRTFAQEYGVSHETIRRLYMLLRNCIYDMKGTGSICRDEYEPCVFLLCSRRDFLLSQHHGHQRPFLLSSKKWVYSNCYPTLQGRLE